MSTATAPIRELSLRESLVIQYPRLTRREIEALQMAADGEDCRSSAQRLGVSTGYVKNLRSFAATNLGADNTTHAVAQALRRGIIK